MKKIEEDEWNVIGKWYWEQGRYHGHFTLTDENGRISGILDDEYEGTYGDKILDVEISGKNISFTRDGRYGIQYWKGVLKRTNGKLIIDNGLYKKKNRDGYRDFFAEKVEVEPKKQPRYIVNMSNIDDKVTLFVNNSITFVSKWGHYGYKPEWYYVAHQPGESGEIDITPYLKKGENRIQFQLWNAACCCYTSFSFTIKKDGEILFSDNFHQKDSKSGIKYDKTFTIFYDY
ncbi:MAG TPA: hypothetical protein P5107_08115 [Thermotogota bacterium]|nr:hypothetical protein [Thermotogota bacterium]